jgi:hypothetical protein
MLNNKGEMKGLKQLKKDAEKFLNISVDFRRKELKDSAAEYGGKEQVYKYLQTKLNEVPECSTKLAKNEKQREVQQRYKQKRKAVKSVDDKKIKEKLANIIKRNFERNKLFRTKPAKIWETSQLYKLSINNEK